MSNHLFNHHHECLAWLRHGTSPGFPPSLPLVFPRSTLHITPLLKPLHGAQKTIGPPHWGSHGNYMTWPPWPSFSPIPDTQACSGLGASALAGRLVPLQAGDAMCLVFRTGKSLTYREWSGVVRRGVWSKMRPEGWQGRILQTLHSSRESGFYSKYNAESLEGFQSESEVT